VFLYSPTPRCGKTRVEEVTSHLAFEATAPLNAPTPPTMRETAVGGGTAIFDTLERWQEKDSFGAAMELLDAGFRSGGVVTKMLQNQSGEWRRELYPVYAPYTREPESGLYMAFGRGPGKVPRGLPRDYPATRPATRKLTACEVR